jgi:hypothetical protein
MRPVPLRFEPEDRGREVERFFDLEEIDDAGELLDRSTALIHAFRAAIDQATEYQALAAKRLADEARQGADRIAERAGWAPEYAVRMIEYGRLVEGGQGEPVPQE